jgi:hypothetical protein
MSAAFNYNDLYGMPKRFPVSSYYIRLDFPQVPHSTDISILHHSAPYLHQPSASLPHQKDRGMTSLMDPSPSLISLPMAHKVSKPQRDRTNENVIKRIKNLIKRCHKLHCDYGIEVCFLSRRKSALHGYLSANGYSLLQTENESVRKAASY